MTDSQQPSPVPDGGQPPATPPPTHDPAVAAEVIPPAGDAEVTQPVQWTPPPAVEPAPVAPPPAAQPPAAQPPAAPTPVASPQPVAAQVPALAAAPAPPLGRRTVGPGFVVTAVLATALLTAGGTLIAVNATDGDASAPAGLREPVASAAPAAGETTPAPVTPAPASPAPATGQGSVVDVVKAVSPAVVTIVAEGVSASDPISGLGGQGTATGSGVIFDASGLILTNRHVVSGNPSKLTVTLKDGRSLDATIYGIDTLTDLAIVRVSEGGLPTAPIGDSSTIQVGQQAIAIGSPLGEFTDSVTSGIVSAIGRSIQVQDGTTLSNLIQTDTAINPGNSGGPLLDANGTVIGINTAVAGDAQGIGFAIPINIARPLLAQASAGQALARPWLGIRFEMIDAELKAEANLPVDAGAWIPTSSAANGGGSPQPAPSDDPGQGQAPDDTFGLTPEQLDDLFRRFGINPDDLGRNPFGPGDQASAQQPSIVAGSPAESAGLREGDIITAVDGTALDATHPLDLVVSQLSPGQQATLQVLRDGQSISIGVTLGTRPTDL